MKPEDTPRKSSFAWICFAAAVLFCLLLLYLVWDLKRDLARSLDAANSTIAEATEAVAVVNEKLPLIVDEVKRGTETLSSVAKDVELIKSVAGIRESQDRGIRELAVYADELQQFLAEATRDQDAMILIEEIFGSDLKDHETAEEFLVGLSKEMVVVILPFAKSKQEVLYRVCHSKPPRRKPFHIRIGEAEAVSLMQFIQENHEASRELPEFKPD